MEKADFEYKQDDFRNELNMLTYAYKHIKEKILENFKHWKELGSEFLKDQIRVEIGEDGESLSGSVAGKAFSIYLMPLAIESDNYVLAVVTVIDLVSKEPTEIDRFLISINGDVLSMQREVLLEWGDHSQSFKLLIAVVRRVIRAGAAPLKSSPSVS